MFLFDIFFFLLMFVSSTLVYTSELGRPSAVIAYLYILMYKETIKEKMYRKETNEMKKMGRLDTDRWKCVGNCYSHSSLSFFLFKRYRRMSPESCETRSDMRER